MKSVFKVVLLGLLFLTGCSSAKKEEALKIRKAELHYSHGTQALISKEYTTALDHLLKADALTPNKSNILNNLGMAFFFKKEVKRGLKSLLLSLKADPKNSDARTNLASVYFHMGNFTKAEEHYNMILKDLVYPHQYRIHYNLALIELKRSSYDKAIKKLKESIAEKDDYCPANFKMGEMAFSRYDYQSALKYYKDATKGNCYSLGEPHMKQVEALIQLRKYTEARLKLSDIKNQFKGSRFDTLARVRLNDLDNLEKQQFYIKKNKSINNFYNK